MSRLEPAGSARIAHPAVEALPALTSLRFFAAMFVLSYHYVLYFLPDGAIPAAISLGYTGVTFFFVLSGFILAYNYAHVDFNAPGAYSRFFAARIARVYPVFLLSLVAGTPFAIAHWLKSPHDAVQSISLFSTVLAPLGLQAWFPGAACAINCPSWSISAELFFYALLPFALQPILRNPWTGLAATVAGSLVMGVALHRLWAWAGQGSSLFETQTRLIPELATQAVQFFPLGRLPEFTLGIVVYALWDRYRSRVDTASLLLLAALMGLLILRLRDRVPEVWLHNGLTAFAWVPLIAAAASLRSGILHAPTAVFLGQISFSLYLLHWPIANMVKVLDRRLLGEMLGQYPVGELALSTGLSLAVAAAVYLHVEEPCRRWLNRQSRNFLPAAA